MRLRATGLTEKPAYPEEPRAGNDARSARKGERRAYVPEDGAARLVWVYDGHQTRHGNHLAGPALLEQVNTTLVLTAAYDCLCDRHGSFVVYRKGQEHRLPPTLQELLP